MAGSINVEQACKDDPALVEWVRAMAPRVRRVASICTGAFISAAAGLLNYRRVTTHWLFSEVLATAYPSIKVDSSLLFARDGNIYSSGGITAGIDLALALVEEDLGREIALATARILVVFPFSAYVKLEAKNRPDIGELQAWILGHPGEDLSVSALADRMAMSLRNFARLFQSETGDTPAQFAERARADAARCKLEQTVVPVETIAKECGFGNAERMRRTFQRLFDVSPQEPGGVSINPAYLNSTIELEAERPRTEGAAETVLRQSIHAMRLSHCRVRARNPPKSLLRLTSTGSGLWTKRTRIMILTSVHIRRISSPVRPSTCFDSFQRQIIKDKSHANSLFDIGPQQPQPASVDRTRRARPRHPRQRRIDKGGYDC